MRALEHTMQKIAEPQSRRTERRHMMNDQSSERERHNRYYSGYGAQAQLCRCPKCNTEHWYTILWTGNGLPKVYCNRCSEIAKRTDEQAIRQEI